MLKIDGRLRLRDALSPEAWFRRIRVPSCGSTTLEMIRRYCRRHATITRHANRRFDTTRKPKIRHNTISNTTDRYSTTTLNARYDTIHRASDEAGRLPSADNSSRRVTDTTLGRPPPDLTIPRLTLAKRSFALPWPRSPGGLSPPSQISFLADRKADWRPLALGADGSR